MFEINFDKIMKDFGFEKREMTLNERSVLENEIKLSVRARNIILAVMIIVNFLGVLWTKRADSNALVERLFECIMFSLLVLLIFGPLIWFWFYSLKKKIRIDLKTSELYLAKAKLKDISLTDDKDYIGFHYKYNGETKYLQFYLNVNIKINLKNLESPQTFKDIDKTELQTLLQKGKMYSIAFSLKSEYLFSIEEVE